MRIVTFAIASFTLVLALCSCFPGRAPQAPLTAQGKADLAEKRAKREAERAYAERYGDKIGAWVAAEGFVEARLVSPGTASFGKLLKGEFQNPEKQVTVLNPGEYMVMGWVDSQNRMGATLRSKFLVVLTYTPENGGTWYCLECVIETR